MVWAKSDSAPAPALVIAPAPALVAATATHATTVAAIAAAAVATPIASPTVNIVNICALYNIVRVLEIYYFCYYHKLKSNSRS